MIRNMAAGDVDALTAIEVACFAAGYADKMMTRADFAEVLGDEHATLFCAVEGEDVAGYAFLILEDGAANFDTAREVGVLRFSFGAGDSFGRSLAFG